jgi:hypothetical protein
LGPYEQAIDRIEKSNPDSDFAEDGEYLQGLMAIELCLNLSFSDLTSKRE